MCVGKDWPGAPWSPTNTMFQLEPDQEPIRLFLARNCCWLPDWICPSILESEMKPPLDQPPSSGLRKITAFGPRPGSSPEGEVGRRSTRR